MAACMEAVLHTIENAILKEVTDSDNILIGIISTPFCIATPHRIQ